MRTDSPTLDDEAAQEIREAVKAIYGLDFLSSEANFYKYTALEHCSLAQNLQLSLTSCPDHEQAVKQAHPLDSCPDADSSTEQAAKQQQLCNDEVVRMECFLLYLHACYRTTSS